MTGLLNRNTKKTLPLRKSSIRAEIKGFTARTTAVLTYYNDNRTEIEGLFKLPLDHTATIVEFEAIIDDHYIYTDVRDPKETVEKQIHHRTKNHQDGYFSISIGKILPMVVLHVQVTIVCEISALILGDALRYTLPQAFSPKVITADEFRNSKSNQAICTSTLGYSFNIEIEIEAPCLLYGVQSNTHPIQVDAPPLSQTGSKIVVSIPEDFQPNNEVFELLMFLCRPREPYIVIEEAKRISDEIEDEDRNPINSIMNNPILMLSYSPDIPTLTNDPCITAQQCGEFILIIDCSITENVGKVKESCILFLKSLPSNSYFNVISCGNEFHSLYPTSQAYKQTALDTATSFVLNLIFGVAKTGALKQPLKWVFEQKALDQKPKQIFILTKGKDNGDILLGTWHRTRNKEALARCFIFHLVEDEEQHHHHLERLATITRGKYITSFDHRLQQQMANCLMAAMQPVITDVNVSWILPDAYDVIYTPEKLPSVFLGERLNLYAILASKESAPGEKPSESVNSVKEFWFEDTDLFQEDFEVKQTHLPITNRDISPYSPAKSETVSKEGSLDYDSEVFLTEEEVRHLSSEIPFPKRSSIDRVQKWKVSKNPENHDIESDFEEDWQQSKQEKEPQHTSQHSLVRKKSSNDGNESVGSSNSYGSNRSSSSHFYPFPGFPTRMSSCRSIEARSPHVPKMTEEHFSFQEQNKLHSSKVSGSQVNLSDYSSDHHSSGHHSSGHHSGGGGIHKESNNLRPMARLTEALYAEKANTHLIDDSNESTIELMLENLVNEKRQKLLLWLREQEEMTQCSWPMNDYEKREYMEKQGWRDSGIGNRSSSDAHTSDIEEEIQTNRKKYFGSEEVISHQTNEVPKEIQQTQSQSVTEVHSTAREKEKLSRKNSSNKRAGSATPKSKPKLLHKVSISSNSSQFQKRKSKAKSMWNSIIEKVRSVGAIVSEKSGEATFKRSPYDIPSGLDEEQINQHPVLGKRSSAPQQEPIYETIDDFQPIETHQATSKTLFERKSDAPYIRPRSQGGYNSHIKTRPIIENSRTISTTSMFEIGKTEIGDIENLHLLPSQALIYLSGQCGEHAFKRIIPFQLEVDGVATGGETITSDTTVHQLAAKSIIHDLELQMEQDLEDHGKIYIKNLISEVSKAANVLSKYTTLVTIDDKSEHGDVLSSMQFDNQSSMSRYQPTDGCVVVGRRKSSTHDSVKIPLDSFTNYAKLLFHMFPDGSWKLNEQLAAILSVTMVNLIESCPFKSLLRKDEFERTNSIHQSIWATSLALAWLQSTCESYKEEWQLAATKSQYWLIKQGLPKGLALKDLTIIAENTLKTLNTWVPQRKTSAYWN